MGMMTMTTMMAIIITIIEIVMMVMTTITMTTMTENYTHFKSNQMEEQPLSRNLLKDRSLEVRII